MSTTTDQRNSYRVSFKREQDDVLARIRLSNGSSVSVRPLDMNDRGLAVEILNKDRPAIALGSEVVVEMTSTLSGSSVTIEGILVNDSNLEVGESRRWGIKYKDPESLQARWGQKLGLLLNRRRAVRVPPSHINPTHVRIRCGSEVLDVSVIDISQSGIGVIVPKCADSSFANAELLELEIELPAPFESVRIRGIVMRRVLHPTGVRYGVEYYLKDDEHGSLNDPRVNIVKYIMARQRELNRGRSRIAV